MIGDPNGKFAQLLKNVQAQKRYQKALQDGLRSYQIKQYHVAQLTPNKIVQMYNLITTKFYFNRYPHNNESWYQNQLRVFIWLVVCYAFLQGKNISQLVFNLFIQGEPDWLLFSHIFNRRNPDIFQFQTKSILKKGNKSAKWSRQQVDILDSIIKSKSIKNKWNEIAKELFIISGKRYFRSAKQCREHWINHLNTNITRSSWTSQEDLELIQTILKEGKKWSKVAKLIGGTRTEHMVKNRFKSLLHFENKKMDSENAYQPQNEKQLLQNLIQKLRKNIEEGDKLAQKLQLQENVFILEEDKEEPIFYEQNEKDNQFPSYLPIVQTKPFLIFEDPYDFQAKQQIKMSEWVEQDCVGDFFHNLQQQYL